MRRSVFLVFFLPFVVHADLVYLVKSIGPDLGGNANGFENVSTAFHSDYHRSGGVYDDALDEHVPIGFNFPFNGSTYSEIIISSNGILYLRASGAFNNNSERSTAADYTNHQLSSSSTPDNAIVPYWDDLYPSSSGTTGTIKYDTLGSGDGEHFVVYWNEVPRYGNSNTQYTFQIVLYKDGTIKYRYKDNNSNDTDGSSATIGVKEDSSHYDENTYNTSNINKGNDIVYRPYQHLSAITPACVSPINKISMRTYDTSGYNTYPKDRYEFDTLVQNYADNSHYDGSGYQDNIDGSGNPYGSNNDYLSIFEGYIYLPDTGEYHFGVDGDDAVEVYLDGQMITGWYGGHGRHNRSEYTIKTYISAGWHKITFHQQERSGGDNYYLYWQRPGGSLEKTPASQFFHCPQRITKTSCILDDPVNNTAYPKRIPGGTIRYAVEVYNRDFIPTSNNIVTDNVNGNFDTGTIANLHMGNSPCNCLNPGATSSNGPNGTGNGVNPVKLDFGDIAANSKECGYFEVEIE